jgi:Flp pilus assembly protein TadG
VPTSSNLSLVRNRRHRQSGQSLVELAVAVPIFLVIVMGIVDFGIGLKTWIQVTNAAREAARYGAIHCSAGSIDGTPVINLVEQRAVDTATGLTFEAGDITVSSNCDKGHSTESVTVDIDYRYKLISPLGGLMSMLGGDISSTITLSSSADMRME